MKIQTKILSIFAGLGVPAVAGTLWFSATAVDSVLMEQMRKTAMTNAIELADEVVNDLGFDSETASLRHLSVTQQVTDASYIEIIDLNGRVVAHTDVAQAGTMFPEGAAAVAQLPLEGSSQMLKRPEGWILEVRRPIWSRGGAAEIEEFLLSGTASPTDRKRMGMVVMGVPTAQTKATEASIVRKITWIVLAAMIIVVAAVVTTVRRMLRPIGLLESETRNIASGRYGHQLPPLGNDEIGGLAQAFNQMSQALSTTTISKDYMSGILANMLDPLLVIDTEGKIRTANNAAAALLGYADGELVGQPVAVIFADDVSLPEAADCTPERGRVANLEANLRKKNGEKVPVLYSVSTLNDKGAASNRLLVARDITERKSLETIVRRSEKMSAVGQLAAGVAHEINNPLGVILGFAQALVRRVQPGDLTEEPLRSIEREAVRCKNLVQDLLTFSRVSNVEREPLDINRAIETSLSLVKTKAKVSGIEVVLNLSQELPRILGNPNQIQQVVINLAGNAVDAMTSGGRLTISTELLSNGSRAWVCLKVHDNGSGIPADLMGKIFEPFFTTKGVGKGTGLGLSLVHEIVKKHSGTIEVQSRPGDTCFTVRLPVRSAPAAASRSAS